MAASISSPVNLNATNSATTSRNTSYSGANNLDFKNTKREPIKSAKWSFMRRKKDRQSFGD